MAFLKLLGGASLETPAGPVTGPAAQRRRIALLARLALARGQGVSRETLIAALWPEQSEERGRHLLSDSIYRINQALEGDAIRTSGEQLWLNPEVVEADVAEFDTAVVAGDHEQAIELYRGPLLEGFHSGGSAELDQWFSAERSRLADQFAASVEALAGAAESRGDFVTAVRQWRRLASHDPLSSRVALRLVQAMRAGGDEAAARKQAGVHATVLAAEFGPDAADGFHRQVADLPMPAADQPVAGPVATTASQAAAMAPPPPSSPPRAGPWRRSWLAFGAGAAGLALLVVWLVGSRVAPPAEHVSLAVLPFTDLSAGGDQQYFADGMTEELISALADVEGLRLATRTSVFALHRQGIDVRQLGERLGVDHVVEGSVRREGGRLRVAVRLARTADGVQLWSSQYDRDFSDIFAVQEELARSVAGALRLRLVGDPTPTPGRGHLDPEVYRLYLQGRYYWHQRTEAGLRAATTAFGEAVRREPEFVRAWLGLGDAYAVLGFYDWLPPHEAFPQARDAGRRALASPETRGEAEALLGYVALYYEWDWPAAERHFEAAVRYDPTSSKVRQWQANFFTAMGRFEEAEHAMREAQVLEPLSLIANAALCWSWQLARRHTEAVGQCQTTLGLNPAFNLARIWQAWAWISQGEWDAAEAALEPLVTQDHPGVMERAALALVHGGRGDLTAARRVLAELRAERADRYIPAYELARAALGARFHEEALDWLDTAFADRAHAMVFLNEDPHLDPLRGNPRFDELVRRVEGGRNR